MVTEEDKSIIAQAIRECETHDELNTVTELLDSEELLLMSSFIDKRHEDLDYGRV